MIFYLDCHSTFLPWGDIEFSSKRFCGNIEFTVIYSTLCKNSISARNRISCSQSMFSSKYFVEKLRNVHALRYLIYSTPPPNFVLCRFVSGIYLQSSNTTSMLLFAKPPSNTFNPPPKKKPQNFYR